MLFAFFGLGGYEIVIVGGIAVLLFGSNLPSTMRSIGASFGEFKKGLLTSQKEIAELENEVKEVKTLAKDVTK